MACRMHLSFAMTKRSRSRRRGLSTVEIVLATAAVMGCFVYPLSMAMRTVGKRLADDSERGSAAILEQAR